jgi:amidase
MEAGRSAARHGQAAQGVAHRTRRRTGALFLCPDCARPCKAHDFAEFTWRHLNFFQHHCYITAKVPRTACPDHGVKRIQTPWAREGSRFTLLFENGPDARARDARPVRFSALAITLSLMRSPNSSAITPELGHGGNTTNKVFGKTLNPWNTALTPGGSSGGSAVALATGQVWLATGSDLGCSLRMPAAFCSVVGLRPSPGRIARGPIGDPIGEVYDNLSVEGSMGRTVADVALMLDAQAGSHPRDPLSFPAPAESFTDAVKRRRAPLRVAFSPDLGVARVAAEIREICASAAARFGELGATVEEACPDLSAAREIFQVLRAHHLVCELMPLLEKHRDKIKPDVIWNIEQGQKLTSEDIARAERGRTDLYYRVAEFFESYDLLLAPTTVVPPFDVGEQYVAEVEGHKFENYFDWYTICYVITVTSCPALSIPCGFTAAGLPVGLQMIGPPRGEAPLLSAAALFEELMGIANMLPIDPRPPERPFDKGGRS